MANGESGLNGVNVAPPAVRPWSGIASAILRHRRTAGKTVLGKAVKLTGVAGGRTVQVSRISYFIVFF